VAARAVFAGRELVDAREQVEGVHRGQVRPELRALPEDRADAIAQAPGRARLEAATRTWPKSGAGCPRAPSACRLAAPFGPTNATRSPAAIANDTSSTHDLAAARRDEPAQAPATPRVRSRTRNTFLSCSSSIAFDTILPETPNALPLARKGVR